MARRFEAYLAGSIMLLIGLLLIAYLLGIIPPKFFPELFLIGVGVIFSVMAVLKAEVPVRYGVIGAVLITYGLIAIIIGVLWVIVSVQIAMAGYVLAGLLIFFGLLFLAYTRIKPESA